jgi:hypothetical protein
MAGCTSGPWEAEYQRGEWPSDPGWWSIQAPMVDRHGVVADTLNRDHVISPEEDAANARLIAASPRMLEACKAAFPVLLGAVRLAEGMLVRAMEDSGKPSAAIEIQYAEAKRALFLVELAISDAARGI